MKISSLLNNQRIALLYDNSTTNRNDQTLTDLQTIFNSHPNILNDNSIDLYQFNNQLSQPQPLTQNNFKSILNNLVHFGTSDLNNTFTELKSNYDLVVVFTNQTPTFNTLNQPPTHIQSPIYLVHTDTIPSYNQTFATYLIQNQGYVTDNLADALDHYSLTQNLQLNNQQLLALTPNWSLTVPATSLPAVTDLPQVIITPPPLPSLTPIPFNNNNNLICGSYYRTSQSNTMTQGLWTEDTQATSSTANCLAWTQTNLLNQPNCGLPNASFISIYLLNRNLYTSTFLSQELPQNTFVHSQQCSPTPDILTPAPIPATQVTLAKPNTDLLASIFNRAYLNQQISQSSGNLNQNLAFLDATNNFAKLANMVTPYSSLLALVNQTQRDWLEQESQSYNRYQDETLQTSPQPDWLTDGPIRSPSLGLGDAFFGMEMREFSSPAPSTGGGGSFGAVSGPSSLSLPDSPIQSFRITSIGEFIPAFFILANLLLLGGGFLVYIIFRLLKRHKNK